MAYGDFKDLTKRIALEKLLRDKAFKKDVMMALKIIWYFSQCTDNSERLLVLCW